jgi:ubiquinone/menaquinone biosynthesis C-methylase UbiE
MATEPTQIWASTEAVERWQRMGAQRQQTLGPLTDSLLDSARLKPADRVLDLAAGTGDTTMLAARRVGPQGSVLAVDISAAMLEEAAKIARREGIDNIQTLVSDIVRLDLPPRSFDAAISRFGLMFLTDIVEGLRRIRLALRPSARLAAVVWSTAERNPWISIPSALATELGGDSIDASVINRAVSLSGSGVFERALQQAGFSEISVQKVSIPRGFDSVDAAVEGMQLNSAMLREVLEGVDATRQQQVLAELRRRLADYAGADGRCVVPGEALLAAATAP